MKHHCKAIKRNSPGEHMKNQGNNVDKRRIAISFIIPVLNEERHLIDVFDSIESIRIDYHDYEIVVVDNGSKDRSVEIANARGAIVYCRPGVTISALRNFGASVISGSIIVFLDGDVSLDVSWGQQIAAVIDRLEMNPLIITGSAYGIRRNATWIEKYWCDPKQWEKKINYINGGHFVLTKQLFEKVGGFDERLETGEDSEFCRRAARLGATIMPDDELRVVHLGYPQRLSDFFRRERWHGRGDYISLKNILSSKPAVLSLSQVGVLIICLAGMIWTKSLWFVLIYTSYLGFICIVSSYLRAGFKKALFYSFVLYSFYFMARAISFFDVLSEKLFCRFRK